MARIRIVHTNDLHNRLNVTAAEELRRLKSENCALLLDAGDAVWAGNVYFRPGGEPVFDLMNLACYDAMALGNREFHFTQRGFCSKLSRASFPVLCANVRAASDGCVPCKDSVVVECGGLRVGIFGVTVAMVSDRSRAARFSAYVFDDPLKTAPTVARRLREECDLLVALTHIGLQSDKELAEACPEIDLIVGGHSHDALTEPLRIGHVSIVQAGAYGHFAGMVEAERAGSRWTVTGSLLPLMEGKR
ncbi:MAG: metallophosphatase [Armatimonadetes bacterium]|nr:metallophosphatase [Armatimonadota bacterium]